LASCSIHGSLLAIDVVVTNGALQKWKHLTDMCELIEQYFDTKNAAYTKIIVPVLPALIAQFEKFQAQEWEWDTTSSVEVAAAQQKAITGTYEHCVDTFMAYLLRTATKDREHGAVALRAFGRVTASLKPSAAIEFLDPLFQLARKMLTERKNKDGQDVEETLLCISEIVCLQPSISKVSYQGNSKGYPLGERISELLDIMFDTGTSETLVITLQNIVCHIKRLRHRVTARLLGVVESILVKSVPDDEGKPPQALYLALKIMGSFEFGLSLGGQGTHLTILTFTHEKILPFTQSAVDQIREAAGLACVYQLSPPIPLNSRITDARLLELAKMGDDEQGMPALPVKPVYGQLEMACAKRIITALLRVCIADPCYKVRIHLINALNNPLLDAFLSADDNLKYISRTLTDDVFEVKLTTLDLLGRLHERYSVVTLYLNSFLLRLLSEIHGERIPNEQSILLLEHVLRYAPSMAAKHVVTVAQVTLAWFDGPDAVLTPAMLAVVGQLANVEGAHEEAIIKLVVPTLIALFADYTSVDLRIASIKAFGKIAQGLGYIVQPFLDYPSLAKQLKYLLQIEVDQKIRHELIRLAGILCIPNSGETRSEAGSAAPTESSATVLDMYTLHQKKGGDSYFTEAAINALMRVANDPSQIAHHPSVFHVIGIIFTHLKSSVLDCLEQVIPSLLFMTRLARDTQDNDAWLRMVLELVKLVEIAGRKIKRTAKPIVDFILESWSSSLPIIYLLRSLVDVLLQDFTCYLSQILPNLRQAILEDAEDDRAITREIIPVYESLSPYLRGWLHLVLPPIIAVLDSSSCLVAARAEALATLIALAKTLSICDYFSVVFHSVLGVLDKHADLRDDAMVMLVQLLQQMGAEFILLGFHGKVAKVFAKQHVQHMEYSRILLHFASSSAPLPLPDLVGSDTFAFDDEPPQPVGHGALRVDQVTLKEAWEVFPKASEEWSAWIKQFGRALLKESNSPALRSCSLLAEIHEPIMRELFNAAFTSCWAELDLDTQDNLVHYFERALMDNTRDTREIKRVLLNLTEFMDSMHKGPLPISLSALTSSAVEIQAYAKALHYKEAELVRLGGRDLSMPPGGDDIISDPGGLPGRLDSAELESRDQNLLNTIADLVEIYNALEQPRAAAACLAWTVKMPNISRVLDSISPTLNEKLGHWEKALGQYKRLESQSRPDFNVSLGHMRCLRRLGMWDDLFALADSKRGRVSKEQWRMITTMVCREAAAAAQWRQMGAFVNDIPEQDGGLILKAMFAIHQGRLREARAYITGARRFADGSVAALLGGRHERFQDMVQTLTELEECVDYKMAPAGSPTRKAIRLSWRRRLEHRGSGIQRSVEVWQRTLNMRALAMDPLDDCSTYVEFSRICRDAGNTQLARDVLVRLLKINPAPNEPLSTDEPLLVYAYSKHLWHSGRIDEALTRLQSLALELYDPDNRDRGAAKPAAATARLAAQCYHKLGQWKLAQCPEVLSNEAVKDVALSYLHATVLEPHWQRGWHSWAMFNLRVALMQVCQPSTAAPSDLLRGTARPQPANVQHAVNAVNGFVMSIGLSSGNLLQDALHLLRLWWAYGSHTKVMDVINEARASIKVDTWLQVIPQLVARIDVKDEVVKQSIHEALLDIGYQHPQAMVFPLSVAARSTSRDRSSAARRLMARMKQHSRELVYQATLVTDELVRTGFLWHEEWHSALQQASSLFYEYQDIPAMIKRLQSVHLRLKKPETLREVAFEQAFGVELRKAEALIERCVDTGDMRDAFAAWDHYLSVYKRISQSLPKLSVVDLKSAAPKLLHATDLLLAVPGTYQSGGDIVTISSFEPQLEVIISKQRPRRLTIRGSDGRKYNYLLKGQEDPRMDERVMSTFSLLNTMLEKDPATSHRRLEIKLYSITPLSPTSGLIGWVSDCDTLHELIKRHRTKHKIVMHAEHKLVRQLAPVTTDASGRPTEDGYDRLTIAQRVELFQQGLASTSGDDLAKMLWSTSPSAEIWLARRNNYTRSLGVMSVVGYVLGLGDRHPSNIMINSRSGFVQHIDFADCFEVAQHREQYPERIPFRLTRMLVSAMDISGTEGPFRWVCENTMRVVRKNPDSLLAILEAFIYDPIVDDRSRRGGSQASDIPLVMKPLSQASSEASNGMVVKHSHYSSTSSILGSKMSSDQSAEVSQAEMIRCAQVAIDRVQAKLTGRDFIQTRTKGAATEAGLAVPDQVQRLIEAATAPENLSQVFMGWCPFW
jgi:FKBP12-rapamycin complex-associated protein